MCSVIVFQASMCRHSIFHLWSSILLVICSSCTFTPTDSTTVDLCSFALLEQDLLSRTENRYKLTKTFFPPRDAHPVFITVNYTFPSSNASKLWYWSESEFYLIQPLEIFQFSSLFLSNLPYRQASIDIALWSDCSGASDDLMEMLTQRLKLYAQSTTISSQPTPARITDGYSAVAASREEIVADAIQTDFVKAWLHIAVIVFPIITGVLLYVCDPIQLLLGDKMWQKLEDEHNHPTVAALIQISVEVTIYVFILDWFGFVYTIRGNFIGTGNSAFYLSVITGMIVDVAAFIWVMFVLATSCHWDCKNMWYRWKKQSCPLESSIRIKKLLCTVMIAPILCIANHCHYIILAFISDPYHAGSITIVYGLSFFLHYFIFRQFYARIALHSSAKPNRNPKPTRKLESPHHDLCPVNSTSSTKPLQDRQQQYTSQRVPFLTHVIIIGLIFVAPLLVIYEAVIIVLFVMLPITKTIEDAPTRLYTLYQGTGILIVALLTYSIILHPNPFSLPKAINTVAKELHLPEEMPNWNKLCDEDRFARCVTTLYLGGQKEGKEEVDSKSNVRKISNVIAVEMPETTL